MPLSQPAHAGEHLRSVRERAAMAVEEVAARTGVDPQSLASIEDGIGTHDVPYSQWLALVRDAAAPTRVVGRGP